MTDNDVIIETEIKNLKAKIVSRCNALTIWSGCWLASPKKKLQLDLLMNCDNLISLEIWI